MHRSSSQLVTIVALAISTACDRTPARDAEQPPALAPAIRLVDAIDRGRPVDAIELPGEAVIDGIARPTLSAAHGSLLHPRCDGVADAAGMRDCELKLRRTLLRTPWVLVECMRPPASDAAEADRNEQRSPVRLLRGLGGGGPRRRVHVPADAYVVRAYGVPDLSTRTVESDTLTLPGGGVLRTWLGVEEPAWGVASARVVFSIERLDGGSGSRGGATLFRKMLDPASRPGDRGWHRVEVPLADLGERPFRLRFSTRPADNGDARPSLPVWGDPTILRPAPEPRPPRRIVLISLDTLRARSMSVYGRALETTPAFATLLREGTLFLRAFTTFSNTLSSHMSMLTGLYPAAHRVGVTGVLDAGLTTLAERLRGAGYETAAFTENGLLMARAGFRRGFARYHENKSLESGMGDAEKTFSLAQEWAKGQGDEAFFLFVHTYEVHAPYLPPEETATAFRDAPAPATHAAMQLRLYEREVRHLDGLLAAFVSALDELGPPEELLLVVTADHGEEFREHGRGYHTQLYDEVMHVPLFLRWRGVVPADMRIDAPVSLVDIAPTILDLAGVDEGEIDGMSLAPLLNGSQLPRAAVFGEYSETSEKTGRWFVARNAGAKCMVGADPRDVRCFDLGADPEEREPLVATRADLAGLAQEAAAYRQRALAADAAAPRSSDSEIEADADPELREKLRALGYLQ